MSLLVIESSLSNQQSELSDACCGGDSYCCVEQSAMSGSAQWDIDSALIALELSNMNLRQVHRDEEVAGMVRKVNRVESRQVLSSAERLQASAGSHTSYCPDGDLLLVNQKLQGVLTLNSSDMVPTSPVGVDGIHNGDSSIAVDESGAQNSSVSGQAGEQGPENARNACCGGSTIKNGIVNADQNGKVRETNRVIALSSKSFVGGVAHMSIVPQVSDSKGVSRG